MKVSGQKPSIIPPRGPVRRFAAVGLLRSVGSGLFMSGSALFFTRVAGLQISEVGFGLSIAAAIGLLTMIPIGRLADRVGGRPVYLVLLLTQAAMMCAYVTVDSFWGFLVVTSLSAVAERGMAGTVGVLVHALGSTGTGRVLIRSYLRSTGNVGISLGALLAGLALQVDTVTAYVLLVTGNAFMLLAAAITMRTLRIPRTSPARDGDPAGRRRKPAFARALRDRQYLSLTVTSGISTLHYHLLSFAMPLWIANWTAAPRWMISAILVVNTVMVVLLQVRASQLASTLRDAARTAQLAGITLGVACAVIAFTADRPALVALFMLALWAVIHSVGELLQASSEFCLSFDLAPDDAQGEYQSTFALGEGMARVVAPGLLSVTVLSEGAVGWAGVGVLLLGAGMATASIARRAARRAEEASVADVRSG